MKDQREIIIPDLDYQAEVRKCKTMEDVVGKNGLMQKLFKDIIQQLLEAEMEEHLGRERHERSNETNPNYRNGYSSKTIESSFGEVGLDIPRDRKAQFEPKVVKKYETVCNELDKKIIGLYACGMSVRDIQSEMEELYAHVLGQSQKGRKILMEFITKTSAEMFYHMLAESGREDLQVFCMTGDDNQIDRKRILREMDTADQDKAVILVATQVVEAGIDIDMDIGYKDISKLDSEEQFIGRINRNFKRKGVVYFFDMDNESGIYKEDYRVDTAYTLRKDEMKQLLADKNFGKYYDYILKGIRKYRNDRKNENGIEAFVDNVKKLDFVWISQKMKLIDKNDDWKMSVYFAREITTDTGEIIDGKQVWERYRELLSDMTMNYAKKQILLSEVKSKMSYFIYQIKIDNSLDYNDRIGELYLIEDAEQYFENGRLNTDKFYSQGNLFV